MPSLGAVTSFEKHEEHGVQGPGFSECRHTGDRVSAHNKTQDKTLRAYRILNKRPQEVEFGVWWFTLIISAFRGLQQEVGKFKTSLGCIVRPCCTPK